MTTSSPPWPRPAEPPAGEPSVEARERGRALRQSVPRSSHGEWSPPAGRPDPIALLEEQNRSRVQELVPIRWGRMLQSPFAFLRGAALVMARDLGPTPSTGMVVQACGDAHLMNFGCFGSPERRLLFDVNDFDETLPAAWEWDVKRLASSVVVAGRDAGLSAADCGAAARAAVRAYRTRMQHFAGMPVLDVWYSQVDADAATRIFDRSARTTYEKVLAQARRRTSQRVLPRLTELTAGGGRRIVDHPPLVTHEGLGGDRDEIAKLLTTYTECLSDEHRALLTRFRLEDSARKVVGVGSVGTRCAIALMVTAAGEPLFLQLKEAEESALAAPGSRPPDIPNGRRVVDGQRMMQAASDIFLGWTQRDGTAFYVRQLYDMKGSAVVGTMDGPTLGEYASLCAWTLARAHARSGDAAAIAGYLGGSDVFDEAVARFAAGYAEQTAEDHAALVEAVRSGRVTARTDG